MRTIIFSALAIFFGTCLCSITVNAADCSGPWSKLPNWDRRTAPCRQLGLESKRGTCLPGQQFETLCDDTRDGRYRTCPGPRPCQNTGSPQTQQQSQPQQQTQQQSQQQSQPQQQTQQQSQQPSQTQFQLPSQIPYPPQTQQQSQPQSQTLPPCSNWDYDRNQPCPPGFINRDCRGSCGPM